MSFKLVCPFILILNLAACGGTKSVSVVSKLAERPATKKGALCKWVESSGSSAEVSICKEACDRGSSEACRNYGDALLFAHGTDKDERAARVVLERACDASDAESCTLIGGFLEHDPTRAAAYEERGCDGRDGQACDALGLAYKDGNGVPKDLARAVVLEARSCGLGYKLGCAALGQMFLNGEGVVEDQSRALQLFEDACVPGDIFDTAPCEWAGDMLDGGFPVLDRAKAKRLYEVACKGGRETSCKQLEKRK